jgi:predicted phosphodiesterase
VVAVLVLSIVGAIVWKRLYGAPVPRSVLRDRGQFEFGAEEFRSYDVKPAQAWSGEIVELENKGDVRFVVFGDMAGADSVLSGRQRGHLVYRNLIARVAEHQAEFAISIGDVAASATELQYRRLRQMLTKFPLPLIVTPGNHDIFDDTRLELRLFHGLFGADHRSFRVGTTQLIIINNAVGTLRDEQFEWVERELSAAADADFRLVFAHKPIFDPREGVYYGMENREHALRLHQMFVTARVTAVFSGHIHALRCFERDGVRYIISGGGGSKLISDAERFHYWTVQGADGTLRLHAYAIDGTSGDSGRALAELVFQRA